MDNGDDFIRLKTEKVSFLNLQRRDEFLQERGALCGFCATADSEFVILMRLILGGLVAEQSADRFTKGQFGSRADGLTVGESITTQILDLDA
ncbi:MAG: hypothetical protein GDA66_18305 [Nitrospira sp. CR1.2]|nr:hypothetical protein [Nitrospira sp. CR1.2]